MAVSTSCAARTELHLTTIEDGVARMRLQRYGIGVPAGGEVAFTPAGFHIMFSSIAEPFRVGERVRLRLTFQHAGILDIEAPVRAR